METNELRELIRSQLQPLTSGRCYYLNAPASAEMPRAVFELRELSYDGGMSLQELEINVEDYGDDTTAAERMADMIQLSLDDYKQLAESFLISIYREQRKVIPENDKKIIRRRLTFSVRLHERSFT